MKPKKRLLIIKIITLSSFFSLFFIGANAHAKSECLAQTKLDPIKNALKKLSDSYGDVPSSIDCQSVDNKDVETLTCSNDLLSIMERLDTQAYVYAYENATKQAANHKTRIDSDWVAETRDNAKSENDLCNLYKEHTTNSLGDASSPYVKKEENTEPEEINDKVAGPSFSVKINLSKKAKAKLSKINEKIIINSMFNGNGEGKKETEGDPQEVNLGDFEVEVDLDETATFNKIYFPKEAVNRLTHSQNYQLTLNIVSARKADDFNLLDCSFVSEEVQSIEGKTIIVPCKLIGKYAVSSKYEIK
ncbi:MAG: hypothetical protein Q9M50_04235 [Methylococcales bacterium]|nr:hypothetical protein [Methylococcales bacterium]